VAQAARLQSGGDREAKNETAGRAPTAAPSAPTAAISRSPIEGRRGTLLSPRRVQAALKVSSVSDPAEREAERVAAAVMSMPDAAPRIQAGVARAAQRSPLIAARQPARAPAAATPRAPPVRAGSAPAPASAPSPGGADAATEAKIRQSATGGAPLSPKTRGFLEPRFKADFGGVRIHTDANARNLASRIGARAFTFGRHIFFNEGQYRPDSREGMGLLAHELTHTIQQSETVQRQAEPAAQAPRVTERTAPQASRLGLSDALDFFADAANAIPGFRMFTILIGFNPINMAHVEASAANILRAIVEFLPGGNIITRVLDSYGIFDRVGSWIEAQLRTLGISGASIRAALDRFLDSLGWSDIFDLGGVWRRARAIFADPAQRIITFAGSLFSEILRFVREAVLRPLAGLAEGTRGYPLLKAVLGQDPVTGEPFPRTAETVIGGFLTLIGQEELWGNIQRANAIPRAWTWFQGALGGLMSLVRSIPGRFMDALRSLEIIDFVVLPRAFARLAMTFGGFLADFGAWALGTIFDLLKIIIEVVAPGVMPYLQRAAGAFQTIVRNPVRFVQTLVRAAIQGFRQFAGNFLTHLRASLVGWLTGAMSGANIYIPQGFNLREILKFVLSVLGLTWANIRAKLVRATSEPVVVALETGFEIVRTLVTEGPVAAWQKILETLGNLRDMVIEQVMEFVRSRIVQAAVTRLLSMLSPAGALIQAIIAIYNTVMFFIERLRQIAQVAASFIDAIATIAAGNIGPAANRVEQTMAGMLTLVISFLARIAGLGRVADAVTNIINRVRQPIDRALDRVVNWIVEQARRLGRLVVGGARAAVRAVAGPADGEVGSTETFSGGQEGHRMWVDTRSAQPHLMMASVSKPLSQHLVDFRREADSLNPAEIKNDTIAKIAIVSPVVAQIETAAQRAGPASAEPVDAKTRLDGEITQHERTIRPHLIVILNNLKRNVPECIDPAIPVQFVMGEAMVPADRPEYVRQLQMQETGICEMTVAQWLRNRGRFMQRGRDPRSADSQAAARRTIQTAIERRLTLPASSTSPTPGLGDHERQAITQMFASGTPAERAAGFSAADAAARAATWMAGQRALHSPDQVAGGEQADITGMGTTRVNSSIGANWGSRNLATTLEAAVNSWLSGTGVGRPVPAEFRGVVKMKVRLIV
jgi:hypothetical protein